MPVRGFWVGEGLRGGDGSPERVSLRGTARLPGLASGLPGWMWLTENRGLTERGEQHGDVQKPGGQ